MTLFYSKFHIFLESSGPLTGTLDFEFRHNVMKLYIQRDRRYVLFDCLFYELLVPIQEMLGGLLCPYLEVAPSEMILWDLGGPPFLASFDCDLQNMTTYCFRVL